jgi:hypothetical protein
MTNDELSPGSRVPVPPARIASPNPRIAVYEGEVYMCPFGYETFGRNSLGEMLAVHTDGGDMIVMTHLGHIRDGRA